MRLNSVYGYDKSYEHVPKSYHVVVVIPRGERGILVQRRRDDAEFSLPTYAYDPKEMSLIAKARHVLSNFGLKPNASTLLEFSDLWQPKYEGGRLTSVDVYYGVLAEGAGEMRVSSPNFQLDEVSVDTVTNLPLSGFSLRGERDAWVFDARARLLFDALSVVSGPFYQEPESFGRLDEIGFELSEDIFSPIFDGVYLGHYRAGRNEYYYRLDPYEPEGRRTGPLDSLAASEQS